MNEDAAIHVVIPTDCRRPELLERTLNSLSQCHIPNTDFEVIVVENGSQRGAENMVDSLPRTFNARYIFVERANKSVALNIAMEAVTDGLVIFLDDDVRLSPDTLVRYAEAAKKYEKRHFFGGPVGCDYEVCPEPWVRAHLPFSARGWQLAGEEINVDTFFLGCNWAAFAADILSAGGFDSCFGPGSLTSATGQETQMQVRLRLSGVEAAYLPEAKVWHYVPVERCTWDWLLTRAYRAGIEHALSDRNRRRVILGYPRYAWLSLFRAIANMALAVITFSGYRMRRYKVHHERWRGACHGVHNMR